MYLIESVIFAQIKFMLRKLILLGFFIFIFFLEKDLLAVSEEMPFRYMGALGANKSFAAPANGKVSPVLFFSHYLNSKDSGIFGKFLLTTTSVVYKAGIEKDNFILGIAPGLNHTVYGAYTAYDRGVNYEEMTYNGHQAGLDCYGYYNINKIFSLGLRYSPAYYFYRKNDDTEVDLPEDHWEHTGFAELTFKDVQTESIDRIKHGAFLKLKYFYIYRQGYEAYMYSGEESDDKKSQKIYGRLGLYYRWPCKINLQLDLLAGYQKNADINNAEKIGSFVADNAAIPGYYFSEFYHHQYVIGKFQLGIPVGFWNARVQPGFNFLYMPKDNKVAGVSDYPHKFYRSVSISTSILLADVLPFFVDYAYGIDAERRSSATSEEIEKGNHEVQVYVFAAFGKSG